MKNEEKKALEPDLLVPPLHKAEYTLLYSILNFSEKLQKFSFLKESETWNSLFF